MLRLAVMRKRDRMRLQQVDSRGANPKLGMNCLNHFHCRVIEFLLAVAAGPRQLDKQPKLLPLRPARIDANRGTTAHKRKTVGNLLGLGGENCLAAMLNDVLEAAGDEEVSEMVQIPQITCSYIITTPEKVGCLFLIAEITTAVGWTAHHDFPDLPRRDRSAVFNDPDFNSKERIPHADHSAAIHQRRRPRRPCAHANGGFGQPVAGHEDVAQAKSAFES